MKTLADLKRNADKYEWYLMENSWFKNVAPHLATWRKVGRIESRRLTLLTERDGKTFESWLDFPKAKELEILAQDYGKYILIFKMQCEHNPEHIMIYHLKPIVSN